MSSRPRDIEKGTFDFAVSVVKLVNSVPRTLPGGIIARQMLRAGTSIGANVEEAQGAQSKREFSRRMNIARSEAREVLYWLRLVAAAEVLPAESLRDLIKEADELVSILTAIVKRSREV